MRFQKLWRFFEKNATFSIIGLFQKLTYLKNEPISKIGLFQKLAFFKNFANAIIIGNVTFFFQKKTPQLLETHYIKCNLKNTSTFCRFVEQLVQWYPMSKVFHYFKNWFSESTRGAARPICRVSKQNQKENKSRKNHFFHFYF